MEHWLELLSYSYLANDLAPLNEVSNPGCTFCAQAETSMKQIYQLGWVSGSGTTLMGFTTDFQPDTSGVYSADITTTQAEIFYYSGEGWLGSSESKPDTPHTITARHVDGNWQLIDYTTRNRERAIRKGIPCTGRLISQPKGPLAGLELRSALEASLACLSCEDLL